MAKKLIIRKKEYPVYDKVKECLDANQGLQASLAEDQLQPLIKLQLIAEQKSPVQARAPISSKKKSKKDILNENYRYAEQISQEELGELLKEAERRYYGTEEPILRDEVYDYAKRIYNQRATGVNCKETTMRNVGSITGVGSTPPITGPTPPITGPTPPITGPTPPITGSTPPITGHITRLQEAPLPTPLWSMDNLFRGEGDVQRWSERAPGPYLVTAKMDGVSALYWEGRLYTRGDGLTGRDITHVLRYIRIPENSGDINVRGEIVIDRKLFDSKYRGRPGRNNTRNSVSGALGAIHHIDAEFMGDLSFVAYEIIGPGPSQLRPLEQFDTLAKRGWQVANNVSMAEIDDDRLSSHYAHLLAEYNYDIDGLVVYQDRPYRRNIEKNPDYAKAYKEALECLLAVTKVQNVEWNVSKDGYLIPTVIYDPVTICGVRLGRATGESARNIVSKGIGPGARIEVIYHAKVNPRVERVLERATVEEAELLPKVPFTWVGGTESDRIHIKLDEMAAENGGTVDEMRHLINIKRIYKFLVDIGAKGVGETTVKKIYDSGQCSIRDFINMTVADIQFLGSTLSKNIVESINAAMREADLAVLMASSGVFGRGVGVKKLAKIFLKYPDFDTRARVLPEKELAILIAQVDGFGDKTAGPVAAAMPAYYKFIEEIPADIYEKIRWNHGGLQASAVCGGPAVEMAVDAVSRNPEIDGKGVCVTGFRDLEVERLIKSNGGTIQNSINGKTSILVRINAEYENSKTEAARKRGVRIVTKEEFMRLTN